MNISNSSFVEILKHIASLPTEYKEKYPYNQGCFDGEKFTFNGIGLIKTVVNRMCLNNGKWHDSSSGEYQKNLSVTGDIDEKEMIKGCETKGSDFSILRYPGTLLYMGGHVGIWIGETEIDGKFYNVIECTRDWDRLGGKRVMYTWVDREGYRHLHKMATRNSRWFYWGLLPWIDYVEEAKEYVAPEKEQYPFYEFVQDVQKALELPATGVPDADTLASTITISQKKNHMHCLVFVLQKYFNSIGYDCGNVDGFAGPMFTSAVKQYQKEHGCISNGEIASCQQTWKSLLQL